MHVYTLGRYCRDRFVTISDMIELGVPNELLCRTFLSASTAAFLSNIVFYSKAQFQDKFYIFKIIELVTTVTHDSNVFKKT